MYGSARRARGRGRIGRAAADAARAGRFRALRSAPGSPGSAASNASRWVASAMNACAVVRASPSAWCGPVHGQPRRASRESGERDRLGRSRRAAPAPKAAELHGRAPPCRPPGCAARGPAAASAALEKARARPSPTWATSARPVSASSSPSITSSSGGASARSVSRRPWMRIVSGSGIRRGRTSS